MYDTLSGGRTIRAFTLVDVYSRECLALVATPQFKGTDVAALLHDAGEQHGGLPVVVQCDNGTEFTSVALGHWAYWNRVQLDFSRPGKPVDNCVCEAFNGSIRRECLSLHWFIDLADVQRTLDAWNADYNNTRPQRSLGQQSPSAYTKAGDFMPRRIHSGNRHSGWTRIRE